MGMYRLVDNVLVNDKEGVTTIFRASDGKLFALNRVGAIIAKALFKGNPSVDDLVDDIVRQVGVVPDDHDVIRADVEKFLSGLVDGKLVEKVEFAES
jgi:predicted regulator of Ras-like GTPase activity (Roadblock/LC7/MglB family)